VADNDNNQDKEKDKEQVPWALVGEYTTLAVLLPVSTAVGYMVGTLLDRWLRTNFFYIIFLILGIVSGFIQLLRQFQKDDKEQNNSKPPPDKPPPDDKSA
jgi:F0F1-type ATP synthase assembly protein I